MASNPSKDHLWLLLGPTASGKTQWALDHLSSNKHEVISIDSCQVYSELSIGSAKVTDAERRVLPHHVVDCVSVRDPYNISKYLQDAEAAHQSIHAKSKIPFYLGGSMLYADKLMHGLDEVPQVSKDQWIYMEQERQVSGLAPLWNELLTLDPSYEHRLHKNDKQRIIRALAVLKTTGRPLYSYWSDRQTSNIHLAMIVPENRIDLKGNILHRSASMVNRGMIDETAFWYEPNIEMPHALRSVGYRQCWSYLSGDIASKDDLIEAVASATYAYVKQQMTWMKRWSTKAEIVVSPGNWAELNRWARDIY